MADYMKANSANLDQISVKLNQIQGKLAGASAALNQIGFSSENGGHLYIGSLAGGMSGLAGFSSVQGGTVASATKRISGALGSYSRCGGSLAKAVRQVEGTLSENERNLRTSFYDAAGLRSPFGFGFNDLIYPGFPINVLRPFPIQIRDILRYPYSRRSFWQPWIIRLGDYLERTGQNIIRAGGAFRAGSAVFSALGLLYSGDISFETDHGSAKVEGTAEGKMKFKDQFKDFNDAHKKELYKDVEYDGDSVHAVERGNFGISAGVGFSEEIHAAKAEGSFDTGWASGEGSVTALEVEAHGSASAGLYSYVVDDIGNKKKVLSPGASVELGTSVTVLSMEGSADLKGGPVHAGVGGDVAIGKASAEVKGEIGMVDGHFALNVGASAEANLVEANANVHAGIDGLGDVKGEVGVTVGIGAHADIGYHDGVIKFDVGASVGLGVSADVSIDIGPAIETVGNIGSAVCDVGEAAFDLAGSGLKAVGEGVKGFVNWLF